MLRAVTGADDIAPEQNGDKIEHQERSAGRYKAERVEPRAIANISQDERIDNTPAYQSGAHDTARCHSGQFEPNGISRKAISERQAAISEQSAQR